MKKIFYTLTILTVLSCTSNPIEKKIIQKIEIDGAGLLEIKDKSEIIKINDSTFQMMYSFYNPMIKKDIRLTKNFIFNKTLDSITSDKTIKGEMKSQGEWVTSNLFN